MEKLINIGEVVEEQLNEVGINSLGELKSIGSKKAWLKIKKIDPSTCYDGMIYLMTLKRI